MSAGVYNDSQRLEYLIMNAYSGLNSDLTEPLAVGLVIGGKVGWPDDIREIIDRKLETMLGETPSNIS